MFLVRYARIILQGSIMEYTLVTAVLVFSSVPFEETDSTFANPGAKEIVPWTKPTEINAVPVDSRNVWRLE